MIIDPKTDTAVAEEKKGLTEEEIVGLVKGDIPLESLPSDKQDQFHNEYIVGDKELPEDPDDKSEKKETDSVAEEPEKKPEDPISKEKKPEKDEDPKVADLKKQLYQKNNELNTFNQKYKNIKERLDAIEKLGSKKTPKLKDDDLFSEETIKQLHNRLAGMEETFNTFATNEKKTLTKEVDDLNQARLMLEIEKFQLEPESGGLKTSKSFENLNNLYVKFQNEIGGPENRQKFLTDPEYRKQKEAEGHTFPIGEADWKKYSDIVAVHNFKHSRGYPDYSSAYLMWCKENGKMPDPVQKAANTSSEETTKKLIENSQETTTLSPNDGRGGATGMTPEMAQAWLTAHPIPKTPEELKTLDEILKRFGGDEA